MFWPEYSLRFNGGMSIDRFGSRELSLIAQYVCLVGERQDVIRMVGSAGALDAVGVEIGKMFGVGKQPVLA